MISGAKRRCIRHIKICARLGDLWGEIGVQKSIQDIISWSIHRIMMTFDHALHLWCRTKLYWMHQNLPRLGVSWGEIGVQKCTLGIISFSLHNNPMKFSFSSNAEVSIRMPNAGVLSPSKFAARLGVIVHGVKLGCKHAQGIYLLICTQDLNESLSFSVDCRV